MRAATAGLALAAGGAAYALARRHDANRRAAEAEADAGRPVRCRVVVAGAGFGGLEAAKVLAGRPGVELTVIDRHNHHLFQPLLYQVATAALAPTDIAAPVRDILPVSRRVRVVMDTVTGVDVPGQRVLCGDQSYPYDELILATGSQPSYFGHGEWAKAATGLKTLEDAASLREQIISAFELAVKAASPAERDPLLTFAMIGGGPNGVEMAGSVAELAEEMLRADFAMPGARARVVVIEAGPRLLAEYADTLSDYAKRRLEALGVEVWTGQAVSAIEGGVVRTKQRTLDVGVVVWTAGTEATPVASWLGVEPGKGGLVPVDADLRVAGRGPVSVVGDAALVDGKRLPGLAPVAKQQGRYAGRAVLARMHARPGRRPFRYLDYGVMTAIARNEAVADLHGVRLKGFPAWCLWAVAHVFFLIGFRNRVLVSTQWLFAYVLRQRSGRLITGPAVTNPGQPPVAKPGYNVIPPSTNNVAPVT